MSGYLSITFRFDDQISDKLWWLGWRLDCYIWQRQRRGLPLCRISM